MKRISSRSIFLFVFLIAFVAGIVLFYGLYYKPQTKSSLQAPADATPSKQTEEPAHGPCLGKDEYVDYPKSVNPLLTTPTTVPTPIRVYDKNSDMVITSFEIDELISTNHYHPIEIHKCGVYAILKPKQAGYSVELWRTDYSGTRKKLIDLAGEDLTKEPVVYYDYDFRIDLSENYLALVRGHVGKDDYAIVIKNLDRFEDAFILPLTEIEKRNPDLVQNISFGGGGWTKDSRYFWADTHYGANTLGFIRIDMQTKTFDLFPAPKNVLGGDALNLEKGLTTVHPGNVWYGIAQITEQEKAKRRAQGIGTELYIHNLSSGERQFVASTTEPLYYFQPRWLSDTVLQYVLPSTATTTYTISQ